MSKLLGHDDHITIKCSDKNVDDIQNENVDNNCKSMINLYSKLFKMKTIYCKHPSSCFLNTIYGFTRNFTYGYSIKTIIKILFLILKRKGMWHIFKALLNKESLYFGLFLGFLTGVFKSLNWSLRFIRNKEDWYNSILSGVLSSLSAIIDDSESRQTNILFVLSRNLDITIKLLDSKGIMNEPKYWGVAVYMMCWSFMDYILFFEGDIAPKFATNSVKNLSAMKQNDLIFKDLIWNRMKF